MPRKAYIADLKRLSTDSGVDGVFDVRSGDDDGEFRFKVAADAYGRLYEISALIPDVSEYPEGHEFHIFVADDNAPSHVSATLNRLPETTGMALPQLLEVVSNAFSSDEDGDHQMVDSQFDDGESAEEYEESDEEDGEDDFFGGDGKAATAGEEATTNSMMNRSHSTAEFRARIRSDLNHVKAAGFKVGHQGSLLDGTSSYVSISCRVSKLGISEEAMQAWQLDPSEYLILVIHYPSGYKSVDHLKGWDASTARRNIGFRVGVSHTYKPSLKEAIGAFTKLSSEEEAKAELIQAKADATTEVAIRGFRNVFISRPLNELLNERLSTILKYRYIGMYWTGAEEFYNDHQGKTFTMTGNDYMDNKYMQEEPIHPSLPGLVTSDHMSDSAEPHSFPLMAMQFLLRHFVRCTEFCLVCHCKLEDDLEALKPYVCDKPLCLYQYMSLGFGPSIEHEIISQPYVVDLLISFCYQSAVSGRLNSFPTGLSLNVPAPHLIYEFQNQHGGYRYGQQVTPAVTPGPAPVEGHKAKFNRGTLELLFDKGISNPVKFGDWIVMPDPGDHITSLHARVIETHMFPVVRVTEPIIKAQSKTTVDSYGVPTTTVAPTSPKKPTTTENTFEDVVFHIYDVNFDVLTEPQKREAIINQLDLLPGIMELKEYLTRNRMATLASWADRISPTSSGILRWIIASNRACIVQTDSFDQSDKKFADSKGEERLGGMDGWMQFRFAMGAPDKERRFMNCVQETKYRLGLQYPTLFAWHGSPAGNWHGIIREGLHFKDALHGRAFGNGCYHSLDFNTSLGYSGVHHYTPNNSYNSSGTWPSSELKMTCALALNEIVNAPAEFVSRSPHLVVAQLDWIQTRYLFVQCSTNLKAITNPKPITEVHLQDPSMTPNGPKSKVVIPLSAMPKNRRPVVSSNKSKGKRKLGPQGTALDPIPIDCDDDVASIATDVEDLNILIEQEPEPTPTPALPSLTHASTGKGKENSLFSGFKSFVKDKVITPKTDFVPGTLDYSKLPLLGEPVWSTGGATKRLQKEYQTLLKVQDSHQLHELGWYTDPAQFNNVYQWIFEMHSFEPKLPLAKQMKDKKIKSIVMEMRFGPDYPMSPPFIRVIRPRFLSFQAGGGGHVTAGGSICMELLTNSGWSAVMSMESVLLQVRLAMSSTDPRPAQLDSYNHNHEYGVGEAVDAYVRACAVHGWAVPPGFREMAYGGASASGY